VAIETRWIDQEQRLLRIQPIEPVTKDEAEQLINELREYAATPAPLYILVDLTQFDPMRAVSSMGGLMDGQSFPKQTAHMEQSRIAIVGGGPMVNMGLQFMKTMTSLDLIRAFNKEDDALRWLEGQSRFAD
jgi:hypothetical protein